MRLRPPIVAFACMCLLLCSKQAAADATAFIGATTTPANRAVKGFAVGIGVLVTAFEFEYASTSEDLSAAAPALKVGSVSMLLQTPVAIAGVQPYVDGGLGIYNESLGTTHDHTSLTPSLGAGVKLSLVGPLRLRLDYRVFKLGGGALYSPAHRIYAGINLKF